MSRSQPNANAADRQPAAGAEEPDSTEDVEAFLEQRVREMYPNILTSSYFVPSVFMHRTHYSSLHFAGQKVAIPETPRTTHPANAGFIFLASDVRDDEAHQHILHCLHHLAKERGEVMFVLSHLQYKDYLGEPCYASAVAHLKRPIDLKRRGDFDMLIIHRCFGLVVGEVKAVGVNVDTDMDKAIVKRIGKAILQLGKAEAVLKHIVSDKSPAPAIRKVMMMPNVSKETLQRVLCSYSNVVTTLRESLCLPPQADPADFCLCADNLSDVSTPWDICHDAMRRLQQWWERILVDRDPAMSDELYINLVARFCGPATMVKVFCPSPSRMALPTLQHGVSETGERFARIVLHPKQMDVLQEAPECLYLNGPPGTGKTLMLVLQASGWLLQGHKVQVVSLMLESLAATYNAEQQLRKKNPGAYRQVQIHYCELKKLPTDQEQNAAVDNLLQRLVAIATEEKLCVIMDEVHWNESPTPLPCDGPPVIKLTVHSSQDHGSVKRLLDCTACGCELACVLKALKAGNVTDKACDRASLTISKAKQSSNKQTGMTSTPPPLQWKDVFILVTEDPIEERRAVGQYVRPACGLVQGLRQEGVPVRLVKSGDIKGIKDVAKMKGPRDEATVIRYDQIKGLERKVVVCVAEVKTYRMLQLHGISRATAQVVWVLPKDSLKEECVYDKGHTNEDATEITAL
ncbi:uncharacterized protein LOC112561749 isoform X2 [Pomacea canaliculata]|uniref:uncharacterized protein LOC112561749 isoform X2 n=1 Tax=Pomacea canaliculata TaxID=400727 RepID=UPI000D72A4B8|nr:uncharacterized protein LOC112561749 isoform X2 [Pomacea canaliculata]